jgi:formylglycine-generating enzyme required for sulfatase activity
MSPRPFCQHPLRIACLLTTASTILFAADGPPEKASATNYAGTKAGQIRDDNGLKIKLAWCPAGQFRMGSVAEENDRNENEGPVNVTLTKGFWLGQTEVTRGQWQKLMQTTPWSGKQYVKADDDGPAIYVTWDDVVEFCQKLTDAEHKSGRLPANWRYALPTEAQWEFACRAGTTTRFSFAGGDAELLAYAWFDKNAWDAEEKYAHLVRQKKANAWGFYDMHGNVWEWCRDWYAETLTGGVDPEVTAKGKERAMRGGGWISNAAYCRSAFRSKLSGAHVFYDVGFRVACEPAGK